MTQQTIPQCDRHELPVAMDLKSMHSNDSAPTSLQGLYECPECGWERRLPFTLPEKVEQPESDAA